MTILEHGTINSSYKKVLKSAVDVYHDDKKIATLTALWDTGTTYSGISRKYVKDFEPIEDSEYTTYGLNGFQETHDYLVDLVIDETIRINNIEVGALEFNQIHDCELLIGMDIIRQGTLEIHDGFFSFKI